MGKSRRSVHLGPFGCCRVVVGLAAVDTPALLPIPISRTIHRFKLTHYRNSVLRDAGRRMLLAVNAYYSPGKGVHGLGSGGGGLSPSQMLRSGPPTFPCPQLTIQKVWQTLQSQPTLGPGEAGPRVPPGGHVGVSGLPWAPAVWTVGEGLGGACSRSQSGQPETARHQHSHC